MRLYDCAQTIRSKNAGPFTLTIDMMFEDRDAFDRAASSPALKAKRIAELYGVPPSTVRICPFERALAIKVTMPRPDASSGAPGDRDVYGSQQHFPLADVEV